jgi:hypothetical protein
VTRDLRPTAGARFQLERTEFVDGRATYRATIFSPGGDFAADAVLADNGDVSLGETGAPPELHMRLLTIAKVVARDATKLRADGMPPWPARVLRWRK